MEITPGQLIDLQVRYRVRKSEEDALCAFLAMTDAERIRLAEEVKRSLGPYVRGREFKGYTVKDFALLGIYRRQKCGSAV